MNRSTEQISLNSVLVTLKKSARAKRIQLRVDGRTGEVNLILPLDASREQALAFARSKVNWIAQHSRKTPEAVPFSDGMVLPFLGEEHRVVHIPGRKAGPAGIARHQPSDKSLRAEILVGGAKERLPDTLLFWLKFMAQQDLLNRAAPKAESIGKSIHRLSVRDTKSRWGSCSSKGSLSFSWRLVFTPDYVRDYLCAHEVAHLQHMNHSPAFWKLCERLCSLSSIDEAETYLKRHKLQLFTYGRS